MNTKIMVVFLAVLFVCGYSLSAAGDCRQDCMNSSNDRQVVIDCVKNCRAASSKKNAGAAQEKGSMTYSKKFEKKFELKGENTGSAFCVSHDGGFMIAGSVKDDTSDGYDIQVTKTNADGEVKWTQTYKKPGDQQVAGISDRDETSYVVAGSTVSEDTNEDFMIVVVSDSGEFSREFVQKKPGKEIINDFMRDPMGFLTYVGTQNVVSDKERELLIYDINELGTVVWKLEAKEKRIMELHSIATAIDGGYLAAGKSLTDDKSNYDYMLIKVSPIGEYEWSAYYGLGNDDSAYAASDAGDNEYYIAGTLTNEKAQKVLNVVRMKVPEKGKYHSVWEKDLQYGPDNRPVGILTTKDNGCLVAANIYSRDTTPFNIVLLKFDSKGGEQWKWLLGENKANKTASEMKILDNGDIAIVGTDESDPMLIVLTPTK